MSKIILPDTIRSKKNSKQIIQIGGKNKPRRPMLIPSKAYKKWETQARQAAKMQYRGEPMDCPVSVSVRVFYKGQQPDLSGCLESVGDCLEGLVWTDDKNIMSWDGSRLIHDVQNPRTEVYFRKYLKKGEAK